MGSIDFIQESVLAKWVEANAFNQSGWYRELPFVPFLGMKGFFIFQNHL